MSPISTLAKGSYMYKHVSKMYFLHFLSFLMQKCHWNQLLVFVNSYMAGAYSQLQVTPVHFKDVGFGINYILNLFCFLERNHIPMPCQIERGTTFLSAICHARNFYSLHSKLLVVLAFLVAQFFAIHLHICLCLGAQQRLRIQKKPKRLIIWDGGSIYLDGSPALCRTRVF